MEVWKREEVGNGGTLQNGRIDVTKDRIKYSIECWTWERSREVNLSSLIKDKKKEEKNESIENEFPRGLNISEIESVKLISRNE